MRKVLLAAVLFCVTIAAFGQAQITTKKEKLSDFTTKTTKIVLSGDIFIDQAIKDAVKNTWLISPYEICTLEEFESVKGSSDYYFLIPASFKSKKEQAPGICYLTLVKGGTGENLSEMLEVISFPICTAEEASGRESAFFPAFFDIIQSYVSNYLETGFNKGIVSTRSLKSARKMGIFFVEEDLSSQIVDSDRSAYFDGGVELVDEEQQAELLDNGAADALISYTIAPSDPGAGSVCFKMIIDARTHELYYYKKHKISKKAGVGFLKSDMKAIAATR